MPTCLKLIDSQLHFIGVLPPVGGGVQQEPSPACSDIRPTDDLSDDFYQVFAVTAARVPQRGLNLETIKVTERSTNDSRGRPQLNLCDISPMA